MKKVAKEVGFDYDQALFGCVDVVYEKFYDVDRDTINNKTSVITFKNPPFQDKKK